MSQQTIKTSAGYGYAGDVSPKDAWETLASNPHSALIDVRTGMEWKFVGLPDLSSLGKKTITVSWKQDGDFSQNPNFVEQAQAQLSDRDAPLFFLCRTGGRSSQAATAMTAQGFSQCYNIAYGFEGDLDANSHRGQINGWKASGLPWGQA